MTLTVSPDLIANAASVARPELAAKARHLLEQFGFPPDAGAVAAVGCVFVHGLAQWAAENNLLTAETAKIVHALAGEAVEALHACAGLHDDQA